MSTPPEVWLESIRTDDATNADCEDVAEALAAAAWFNNAMTAPVDAAYLAEQTRLEQALVLDVLADLEDAEHLGRTKRGYVLLTPLTEADYYGAVKVRHRPQINLPKWQMREACAYWLDVARHRVHLWRWLWTWDEVAYLEAVEQSSLKPKVRKTLAATAATATPEGITRVSRHVIAEDVGCRRVATVTDHWKAGEAVGLMASKRRFNASKLIQLTLEPGDHEWINGDVSRIKIEHAPGDPAF